MLGSLILLPKLFSFNLAGFPVFTSRFQNSADPDQLASEKPADLELHCFKKLDISGVNILKFIYNHFFRILQHLKMKM